MKRKYKKNVMKRKYEKNRYLTVLAKNFEQKDFENKPRKRAE